MRIVVLQERNEGGRDRSHLVRSDIHIVDFFLRDDREVSLEAALDAVFEDVAVVVHADVGEGDELVLLLLGAHVVAAGGRQVHLAVLDVTVRGLDESECVDAGIDAQGGDQTDVRTFRGLDRAEAAVVRVVHVTDFEARAVAAQTAGTEGGKTTLVSDLSQRVGLVHELGQLARAEERIDHGRERLRVDQVDRVELLAVADVHALADGAGHTAQTHAELVGQLLADRADTAVGQVVDIVDRGLGIDQLDEILDDLDDVGVGQNTHVRSDGKAELLVEAEAADIAQVVSLLGEEELVDDVAGRALIRRFRIAELLVDVVDGLDFGVGRILLQGVEDDGVLVGAHLVLLQEDALLIGFEDGLDGVVVEDLATVDDDLDTLNGGHLAGVLVDEVLELGLQHVVGELAALGGLEVRRGDLDLVSQVEDVDDILVGVVTDGPEQGGHRQFLLTVDVRVHDIVDVRRELDPGSLERNDTGGIKLRSVGVHALVKEHAGGSVELGHDDTLRAVDHERAGGRHVRDVPEIDVLDAGIKVLVLRVSTGKAELGLERDVVRQSALQALLDGILRGIDEIIDELQFVVVPRILNREDLLEYLVKALVLAVLRRSLQLEEVPEGLQLHFQQVRILQDLGCCEVNTLVCCLF